jgi:hypothetical protein
VFLIELGNLKALLRQHRWTLNARASGNQQIFSAKQRQGKRLVTLYIATENTLQALTEDDIVEKINRKAAEQAAEPLVSNRRTAKPEARPKPERL